MLAVRPYFSEDYIKVLPILKDFAPHISDEKWKLLLEYKWENKLGYRGMILENNGELVGFLSFVLHQKNIDGNEFTFCNLSSWVVKTEFRGKSLQLLSPIFKIKNIVILNLSPHKNTLDIFNALRFELLSDTEYTINPFKLKYFFLRKGGKKYINAEVIDSVNMNKYALTNNLIQTINDHRRLKNLRFFFIEINNNQNKESLVVAINLKENSLSGWKNILKELPYLLLNKRTHGEIMYCSSNELLVKFFTEILNVLFSKTNARIINISDNFLNKTELGLEYATRTKKDRPVFFYTDTEIKPSEINFLYTEKVLLNF
jgi:hypothetical protein